MLAAAHAVSVGASAIPTVAAVPVVAPTIANDASMPVAAPDVGTSGAATAAVVSAAVPAVTIVLCLWVYLLLRILLLRPLWQLLHLQ